MSTAIFVRECLRPPTYNYRSKKLLFIAVVSMLLVAILHFLTMSPVLKDVNCLVPAMRQACGYEQPTARASSLEGTSGELFSGEAVRKYTGEMVKYPTHAPKRTLKLKRSEPRCERWAVLTTIFEPTEAVRRQVKLMNWCLVIVSDLKTPTEYITGWVAGEGNDKVVFLTPEDQERLNWTMFVNAIPWKHFGRKNIGYLYAIAHGASVIWDFDDDNMLKFWISGAAPAGAPSLDATVSKVVSNKAAVIEALEPKGHNWPTYNLYPTMGAPALPSWPRGLPLVDIKHPQCSNATVGSIEVETKSIAVLQSLADVEPDVDAIYRITMPMPRPFAFKRTDETKPLMIPTGVLTPYNAQATIHFKSSFWALLLPVTVTGRVSDIWRSYFAQRLFWDCGLQVGFTERPLVVHDRSEHSNLGDLDAERDLYMKSEHLVKFLGSWKGKTKTLVKRIEELWIALYEHQYIELEDVTLVQYWLESLLQVGYMFPELNAECAPVPLYPQPIKKDIVQDAHCETSGPLTFWTADLYDQAHMDVPSMLAGLGHKVILAGNEHINNPLWNETKRIRVHTRLSDAIKHFNKQTTDNMMKSNFEFYRNDARMSSADAFVCSSSSSLCELWLPFNKTILYVPAHRYNAGKCTKEEFDLLTQHLYPYSTSNNPNHIIAALSRYNYEYLRHYTGLSAVPLYSYSGFYTSGHPYRPTRDEILVFGWDIHYRTAVKNFMLVEVHKLYKRYRFSDIVNHRAIVYHGYPRMSYEFMELYFLGVPLFVPSMKFHHTFRSFDPDQSYLSKHNCNESSSDGQMSPHPSTYHPYNPYIEGSQEWEAKYYWLQFSDFYTWPHITYFDDFMDLEHKLMKVDFKKIHHQMVMEVESKKKSLLKTWCKVSQRIQRGRSIPSDYKKALLELHGTTRLQVK